MANTAVVAMILDMYASDAVYIVPVLGALTAIVFMIRWLMSVLMTPTGKVATW